MIVIYAWATIKKVHDPLATEQRKITWWRGIFLFGFIPLAVWVTRAEYK